MRPMLAAKFTDPKDEDLLMQELALLHYPLFASPKIDGIRAITPPVARIEGAHIVSRTWKPLPNLHLQDTVKQLFPHIVALDGELIVGDDPTVANIFNLTQSAVMTHGGEPRLTYFVFDTVHPPDMGYDLRLNAAHDQVRTYQREFNRNGGKKRPIEIVPLEWCLVHSPQDVLAYEQKCLERGFEGICLRHPHRPYKFNRSSLSAAQQHLIKLKRMEDDEATIIGFEPLQRNDNPQTRNVFGLATRSSHKVGKREDDLLGKLVVFHPTWGEFRVGSGFDVATREEIWQNRETYRGKTISFKYQKVGSIDKPRLPIYKGLRYD